MELTYEERLLLDNSKEHLRVVQGNLRIASEELSMVLSLVNAANQDLVKITEQKEKIQNENTKFLEDVSQIKSAQDRREISLNERENKIDDREKELEERVSQVTKKLEDINETARISLKNYLQSVDAQNIVLVNLKNNIASLKLEKQKAEELVKERFQLSDNLGREIEKLSIQLQEDKKKLNKFQDESFDEMKETILLIEAEKEKIKNPLELIKREQEKLNALKKDLGTIKLRLAKQFEAQNPDKLLPIELQEKK